MSINRFALYQGKDKKVYWSFIAANGETVADGSQGYKNEEDARNGIKLIQNSKEAPVMLEVRAEKPKAVKAKRK